MSDMRNEAYRAGYREGYDNALAEQPFDRAAVIEECARLVEDGKAWHRDYTADPLMEIAAAIRALKDKP